MKQGTRTAIAAAAMLALLSPAPIAAQENSAATAAPTETDWGGLLRVKAKKLDAVYLLPEADFRPYTKVMLDPTEVAFRKNWQRDQNRGGVGSLSGDVSDADARRILDRASSGFDEILTKAFQDAGFTVVTEAGPDVLHVETAVINLDITAPDTMSAGRTRTYSREAGEATLVMEVRDSLSGSTLGRAIDEDETGDMGLYVRNRATNTADFERLFRNWAKSAANGLVELRDLSPVDASGALARG